MQSPLVSIARVGEYSVLSLALPGQAIEPIGILLLDAVSDRLYLRLRGDWDAIAAAEEHDFLDALDADLAAKAAEMGGRALLESLEDALSNTLRLSGRRRVEVDSFTRVLNRLFIEHIGPEEVQPFRTHLPLYSLRAAAGKFGEDRATGQEPEGWVRVTGPLRLDGNMFVARVAGRSMEPRIPDGSLNVFRAPVIGSRQNRILLVERAGSLDESARYTVKKYTSRKNYDADGEWRHESIRLEPLNPEFEPFELAEGECRVIAEWVQALE